MVDGPGDAVRVLPDGCMDLIRMHGRVVVAGPDTTASVSPRGPEPFAGLRFRPGRPAAAARRARGRTARSTDRARRARPGGRRTAARGAGRRAGRSGATGRDGTVVAADAASRHVPARGRGPVARVARDMGWSNRTLQRQSRAVYGYGPATLRRDAALPPRGVAVADRTAVGRRRRRGRIRRPAAPTPRGARAGRAYRCGRWAGSGPSGANRSTEVPSGSSTVA